MSHSARMNHVARTGQGAQMRRVQLSLFGCNARFGVATGVCALPPHADALHYDGRHWFGSGRGGPWAVEAVLVVTVAEILQSLERGGF